MTSPMLAYGQDWYVAPSITYFDDDGDRKINDSLAGGQVAFGRSFTEHLSAEVMLGYLDISGWPDTGGDLASLGQKHLELGIDLLAYPNRDWTFAPYFLVGAGFLSVNTENPRGGVFDDIFSEADGTSASLGLGFNWKMGESKFSIRGEYRTRFAFGSNDNATDYLTSLGLQYSFGRKSSVSTPPQTNIDTDGDGVLDMWDECPNTPRGTQVTSRGCELVNIDRDADGDRIFDRLDECPNTPSGVPVDQVGCSLDSDRDGVTTDKDRCPASPPGAVVDAYGCSRDDDRDGVPDHLDKCPDTRAGATVDVNGCEFTDVIELPGVNFGAASDRLLPGTESYLKFAADTLNKHSDLQIEVAGHTDSDGPDDANYGLSERRAKTVRDYLVRFGVSAQRLTVAGYGESQPIADNATVRGRATNRRVELRILR